MEEGIIEQIKYRWGKKNVSKDKREQRKGYKKGEKHGWKEKWKKSFIYKMLQPVCNQNIPLF